jgi:hypothetical protein
MDLGGVHGEQTVLKDDSSHWGALYEYSLLALGHGTQFTSSFDFKVLVSCLDIRFAFSCNLHFLSGSMAAH